MDRKLDAAIADALGYEVVNGWAEKVENGLLDRREIPKYSTDGNAMLELIEESAKKGIILDGAYYDKETGEYIVNVFHFAKAMMIALNPWKFKGYDDETWPYVCANETMPMAVALATYHALTGKEWTSID